jgi:hypothetical protein
MTAQTVILQLDNARDRMAFAWKKACEILEIGKPVKVTLDEYKSKRSLEQNAKLWACLTDIARQVQWPVDGKLQYLTPDDWKDILTAGLHKSQRVAQGVDGGFVMLGQRTSKMKVGEMVELIEFVNWFGAEKGVRWSEEGRAS